MAIEWDSLGGMPPLKNDTPPVVGINAMVAIGEVRLSAGDLPRGILRNFYEGVVGLTFVKSDENDPSVRFKHLQRSIILERGNGELRSVGFLVKDFSAVLLRLRDRSVPYELLHIDSGMTRMAVLRDPVGNWVHLVETREF